MKKLITILALACFCATQALAEPITDGTYRQEKGARVNDVRSSGAGTVPRKGGGVVVADGNTDIPSYVVSFNVAPVAAMDVLTIPTATAKVVRLRRVVIVNPGNATAAATVDLQLGFATSLGSGGTTPTPQSVDQGARVAGVTGGPDTYTGGSPRTGDTTQAGGFVAVYGPLTSVTVPTTAGGFTPLTAYDSRDPRFKSITLGSASALAIVLRIPAVGAGATGLRGYAEFTVDDV